MTDAPKIEAPKAEAAIVKSPVDQWRMKLAAIRPQIEAVLPKHLTVERFVQQTMLAITRNPKITECTQRSIFDSVISLAELGLDPSGALGSGYLIPFKVKGTMTCTPVPGYRGLIDLAVRSGEVKGVKAEVVFWGDEFDIEEGDKPRLYHKPKIAMSKEEEPLLVNHRSAGNVRGAYSVATMSNGIRQFCWMGFADLEAARLRSPGGKSDFTPWATDRVAMYQKCPIRRGAKQWALSPVKASLLQRMEEMELANEKLVETTGPDDEDSAPKLSTADRMKEALKKKSAPAPVDAEWVSEEPPPDMVLPTAKK